VDERKNTNGTSALRSAESPCETVQPKGHEDLEAMGERLEARKQELMQEMGAATAH
jgi:hypothetical protein